MGTAGLVVAIMTLSVQLLQNTTEFVHVLHEVHSHTTSVVYRKALKPGAKSVAQGAKKVVGKS